MEFQIELEQEENLEKILEIESNQSEKVEKSPAHRSVYASEEHARLFIFLCTLDIE